ncbi:hypothetical protein [Sphingomonas sp.]|uniref:glucosamine inositolphosphorylceramide transferase family protein n=1 Tax=Sphingomonas sp. TaxID=28214 RepID=UPI0017F805A5|nr:hypothetical protein [Sphingomonas sp.]MBA3511519.1 hypothetical protein [Sphingomonas sp.]
MKIALIVDNMRIAKWQADALALLEPEPELLVYNCRNTRPEKRRVRFFAYYALNLFTIRNALTRATALPKSLKVERTVDFDSVYSGAWQELPSTILQCLRADAPDVILKFGMGLLKVPPPDVLATPILSYHHGDPAQFRGRPAGFYELLGGEQIMGQVVQRLSNRLDAGAILAFAESKVFSHSYKATLLDAFGRSPLLLKTAIENALSGTALDRSSDGKVYRLPRTWDVLRLIWKTTRSLMGRLAYGAFMEKAWRVSIAEFEPQELLAPDRAFPAQSSWHTYPTPRGYRFLADPFFAPSGSEMLLEALRSRTGKGEILKLGSDGIHKLSTARGHHSYPAWIEEDGRTYLIPEVALWAPPAIYEYRGDQLTEIARMDVPGDPRILDPTLFRHGSRIFLFGNLLDEGPGALRLWHAPDLFGRFEEHRRSPIRISPSGSRMAGFIVPSAAGPLRLGQLWHEEYGNGIAIFRIQELTVRDYREEAVGRLQLDRVKGPHTLNFSGQRAAFDWYEDQFSPLAGVRRLLATVR